MMKNIGIIGYSKISDINIRVCIVRPVVDTEIEPTHLWYNARH